MYEIQPVQVQRYLSSLLGAEVRVLGMTVLGRAPQDQASKGYGYGTPIRIDYQVSGEQRIAVLHTISPGPFGHEHMADRAQELLWEHQAFNLLPSHVRSLDVGGFEAGGKLISLGKVEEVCLLTEYAEGQAYASDLARLQQTGTLTELDLARADALCDYLVDIHRVRSNETGLYARRIRELVGSGECIMGLTDSYPAHPLIPASLLQEIEHRAVRWRWRLKNCTHRLCQVHGDFHPWNILFRSGADFGLLDRSRGEFGDAADDVTCLTLNYFFFSLQHCGRLEGAFETLFLRFWNRYLERSGDREMLSVSAPYFAFRGLVMASPLWYPNLAGMVRERLLKFILAVLEEDSFDPARVNEYCGV